MAIAPMAKVMIVCHRAQASDLLEALQREGICQILRGDEAAVGRDAPELIVTQQHPKDLDELLGRLDKVITFLKGCAGKEKGTMLAPRPVVDRREYEAVVTDTQILTIVDQTERLQAAMEKARAEADSLKNTLSLLKPWSALETPVEELCQLRHAMCWAGLIPTQHLDTVIRNLAEAGGELQQVGSTGTRSACIIVALKESVDPVQKLLRSVEFEAVSFERMSGTVRELIEQHLDRLKRAEERLEAHTQTAADLAKNLLKVRILHDHYRNLLAREQTKDLAPATEHTVILEAWVKKKNYPRLEATVSRFSTASVDRIAPAPGEEVPVDVENPRYIEPFEVITRLYGMPQSSNVDPTPFLAPYFALFFGICLGDAGYGLVLAVAAVLMGRKMQGDKKLVWMLAICAVPAIIVGVLTGSWFGDAVQRFVPGLQNRNIALWFDPMKKPMTMFLVSIALGYVHLMTGLLIAFIHNLKSRAYAAAVFEQLTWLVMLNSIILFGLGKAGYMPAGVGGFCGRLALVPAVLIVLFSTREGGWGGRIGMGVYSLFSTVFYLGDVLSYLRLMALGMVSSGLGMAMNVMTELALKLPYIGIIVAILVFTGGHLLNLVLAVLGAFVHTMRLQFVEFFPKFLAGGGRQFEPLRKEYKHISLETA